MTDDEIDAAIRAVVPAECFRANAGARAIYRAGFVAGCVAAIDACEIAVPMAHTYASENADIYLAQDTAKGRCISEIRRIAKKV